MFVYIAGAGAMGCRFGYQLHKAGNEVVLLDMWKDHIQAIKNDGLKIVGDTEDCVKMTIMEIGRAHV